MSAGSRALEAVIRMRDEASRTLRQVRDATRALQNQTNSTSQAQERLQEQFRKVSNAAKIAGAGIVTGIGAGLVSASKAGAEFETAMTKTSTMFGDTKVDTENLNNKVLELSKNTGIAASSIGESLYNALSSGIPVTKDMGSAMDFMTKNAKLSKAGFTDIDTALTATAKVLNAYKMDVSETDRVHKVMMQTQNKGITTVGELGATLAQVTPTASAMSFSFEQVGASLANMTAQGTPTAQATTQLNSLLAELGKTGTVANKSLLSATKGTKYAGKSFKELMQAGVPLNEILNLMDGSAKKNKKSLIDMFGSIEAGKAALALSGQNSE
ncbi:TPA: phage tail tape measure protein, partial [Clostridioides difficile]|nr:phage tail tape measure protein [Clostridioides difficile]